MEKRSGAVTFAGGPVTLVGPEVKVESGRKGA